MKLFRYIFIGLLAAASCKKFDVPGPTSLQSSHNNLAKGADPSWVTQMEANGYKFYNTTGEQADLFQILKNQGINSIRLRVWVNPDGGWNGEQDVINKAKRANSLGLKLLIDFHYSDSWADPAQQVKPTAWQNATFAQLTDSVYYHTYNVLNDLKNNGIVPSWVQVGNETNDGMLWPDGQASKSFTNYATLINAGYKAVKDINDSIKVIIHLANGDDNSLYRWMFDSLTAHNTNFDVIGMSLYPSTSSWQGQAVACDSNLLDMSSRYNKEVMLCEVGMGASDSTNSRSFVSKMIDYVDNIPNKKGIGVFYWEPEAYGNWQNYLMGSFNEAGMPTIAMKAFY
ncbi:glycoside hydrolase family 53 protein [Rhizosphaericola mali]|uniref:Arabinogalactan endo-beta-1,4-galactanase n=1 Tax=Rhizosphaericola mali TaxID=2545455 RepID=A0A5P2FZZ0_9BACT|nr:glycosyl hydrolase 53 family protein [Rhizosphaericola mali]QES89104.1 arabinogalactan endo-1,4-beta-galactosidase [Rhizosphaericola mali]